MSQRVIGCGFCACAGTEASRMVSAILMRWLWFFYIGLFGWLVAAGQVVVFCVPAARPWLALALLPLVAAVMFHEGALAGAVERMAADVERFAERRTGKRDSVLAKILMALCVVWVALPVVVAIGR